MLIKSSKDLERALSHNECSDVDGYMLAEVMEASKALVPSVVEKPLDSVRHIVSSNAADEEYY